MRASDREGEEPAELTATGLRSSAVWLQRGKWRGGALAACAGDANRFAGSIESADTDGGPRGPERRVVFGAEQVLFLDGYPKRDFGALALRFLILLPHRTKMVARQLRPLLPRAVISDMLAKHLDEISNRLGWVIISYERFPRYDQMTEFMNIAIIPIILFSVPLMVFLAYWTSTLSVTRRTMEIIAEQNAEIDRQAKRAMLEAANHQHHADKGNPRKKSNNEPPLILDVSKLSSGNLNEAYDHHHLHVARPPHFHPTGRRTSRRQSSVEDLKEKRRSRGMATSHPVERKKLKTGSLVLGAFRH